MANHHFISGRQFSKRPNLDDLAFQKAKWHKRLEDLSLSAEEIRHSTSTTATAETTTATAAATTTTSLPLFFCAAKLRKQYRRLQSVSSSSFDVLQLFCDII